MIDAWGIPRYTVAKEDESQVSIKSTPVNILLAEDDEEQYEFLVEVFKHARLYHELTRFKHGGDLLDYLLARGAYAGRVIDKSIPCIVLLDMDMPVMEGKETLKQIKSHAALRKLPVVMLTGSEHPHDIEQAYDLGAASYIRKPVAFDEFLRVINGFGVYWLSIVELPPATGLPGPSA